MQTPTSSSQSSEQPSGVVLQEIQYAAAQPTVPPPQAPANAAEPLYLYVDTPQEETDLLGAAPFQRSDAQPALASQGSSSGAPSSPAPGPSATRRKGRPLLLFSLVLLVALIVGSSVALLGALAQKTPTPALSTRPESGMPAQPTPPRTKSPAAHNAMPPTQPAPGKATPAPVAAAGAGGVAIPDWVPRTLPASWLASGLTLTDAIYALRTATTFTDREMALDYRTAGTPQHPSGSFTAATFLLTPAAQARFLQHDRRSIDHALFQQVHEQHISQAAVDELPRLLAFRVIRGLRFAWVDVAFRLWRAQTDPMTGAQTAGEEIDPATGQARVHHLVVLLIYVPPQEQGAEAPMGGTGWLVSNYALDQAGVPPVLMPA
jgi:hypothetical protein